MNYKKLAFTLDPLRRKQMVGLSENGKTCHFLAFLRLFIEFCRAFVRRKLNCHGIVTPTQVRRPSGCEDRRQSVQNWGFIVGPSFPDRRQNVVAGATDASRAMLFTSCCEVELLTAIFGFL